MGKIIKVPLPAFNTASLGSVAVCKPDIAGRKLHGFNLQVVGTGNPFADEYIEYVLLVVNDKQKILIKPTPQRAMQRLLDVNDDGFSLAYLPIPLTRPGLGLNFSRWGTADISSLSIEVKIAGANPNGKTLTKIRGFMVYEKALVPENRGDVFLQSVIPSGVPVAGWNEISDLPVKDIEAVTKAIFVHNAVREVRISIGESVIFNMTRDDVGEAIAGNPRYALTSAGKVTTDPLLCFYAILDDEGLPDSFHSLYENGSRRPLKVEYYWDTAVVNPPVSFDILVEGIERGAK